MTDFDPQRLDGASVIGPDGAKLGTVDAVYYDNVTDRPAWVAVRTGLFGTHVSLVPLTGTRLVHHDLQVGFGKDRLTSAPHHDPSRDLSPQDEIELYRHYDVAYEDQRTDDAMTRSEERLRVRTESQGERVRLRKHVVTEYREITVPVRREVLSVERDLTGDAPGPDTGPRPAAAPARSGHVEDVEREIVLHEERPVVHTETVPVERVRLGKDQVQDEQTVTADVRKEQIDTETDAGRRSADDDR
jgi:uncharacterized protein (TIGR02271 family)